MRKVFEHPTAHEVGHYESILKSHGIDTFINNQNASMLMGEAPVVAVYPELWVLNDEDYDRAIALLKEYRSQPSQWAPDWMCASCGEKVPGTFSCCWNCQAERPTEGGAETSAPGRGSGLSPWSGTGQTNRPLRYALTLSCIIFAALAFVWKLVAPETAFQILAPRAADIYTGRWDGLLGCVFLHADLMHLAFNLYWLWIFGSLIETYFRKSFWVLLFLSSGLIASAAELAFAGEIGIGLSGVVYGLFGFLFFAKPQYPAFQKVLNQNVTWLLFGWLVLCIFLSSAGVYAVANGAHIGGLAAGSLIGWLVIRSRKVAMYTCAGLMILSFASVLYAPWSPAFLAVKAYGLLQKGKTEEATALLERVAKAGGYHHSWAIANLAITREEQGDYRGAKLVYENAAPNVEKDFHFLNSYAWLLATAPDPEVRDGKKAVELANKAAELTDRKEAAVLDTLAAAYAEAGDFGSAVKWQTVVLDMAPEQNIGRDRLELYKQGKAYRQIPKGSAVQQ